MIAAARPGSGRDAGDAGSIFVESMIAAAIVALALGATFRVIADGANRERAIAARRTALLVAQSELAAVGSDIPLRYGQSAGQSGDMIWRVTVAPYGDGIDAGDTLLWKVTVAVQPRAGGRDLVTLSTLRLGPKTG